MLEVPKPLSALPQALRDLQELHALHPHTPSTAQAEQLRAFSRTWAPSEVADQQLMSMGEDTHVITGPSVIAESSPEDFTPQAKI